MVQGTGTGALSLAELAARYKMGVLLYVFVLKRHVHTWRLPFYKGCSF